MDSLSAQPDVTADRPLVSVIVPHLNQPDEATRCLQSLLDQTYPADRMEIILVDNGSQVDLTAFKQAFPGVSFMTEPQPGPGLARNMGVAAARGSLLAFIDADCVAHPNWIASATTALLAPGASGAVGGDVRIGPIERMPMTTLQAYETVFAFRQKMYIEKMGFSVTANMAVRRDVFERVGVFGDISVAEDRDWGRRARLAGHPLSFCADMIVWHPARNHFGQMEGKWRRLIAHDIHEHRSAGKPIATWYLKAFAVAVSPVVDAVRVFACPRLTGVRTFLRAIYALFRVRLFRGAEMIRQARSLRPAADHWNRS